MAFLYKWSFPNYSINRSLYGQNKCKASLLAGKWMAGFKKCTKPKRLCCVFAIFDSVNIHYGEQHQGYCPI